MLKILLNKLIRDYNFILLLTRFLFFRLKRFFFIKIIIKIFKINIIEF